MPTPDLSVLQPSTSVMEYNTFVTNENNVLDSGKAAVIFLWWINCKIVVLKIKFLFVSRDKSQQDLNLCGNIPIAHIWDIKKVPTTSINENRIPVRKNILVQTIHNLHNRWLCNWCSRSVHSQHEWCKNIGRSFKVTRWFIYYSSPRKSLNSDHEDLEQIVDRMKTIITNNKNELADLVNEEGWHRKSRIFQTTTSWISRS